MEVKDSSANIQMNGDVQIKCTDSKAQEELCKERNVLIGTEYSVEVKTYHFCNIILGSQDFGIVKCKKRCCIIVIGFFKNAVPQDGR